MKIQLMQSLLLNVNWNLEEWKSATSWFGLIVLLLVGIPVLLLILVAIFGKPIKPRVTVVFIGTLFVLTAGFLLSTLALGLFTCIFVP